LGVWFLVLVVVVVGNILRPAETSGPPEGKEAKQIREQGKDNVTRELKLRQLEARRSAALVVLLLSV
jgi:hypothetical protein